jgi:hypothetical protein
MKKFLLTKGYYALIDDEDFEKLSKYRWKVVDSGKPYAARSTYKEGRWHTVYMHRELCPTDKTVDHINGNSLDNQKINLRPATVSEQAQNRKSRTKGPKGVQRRSENGMYRAYIGNRSIGQYASEIEASSAYDSAALEKYGSFAK